MFKDIVLGEIDLSLGPEEIDLVEEVARSRPDALRNYDQIWMKQACMYMQAKIMAPYLQDEDVVFVGDGDAMSLMFGLLGVHEKCIPPRNMTILDFDERVLGNIDRFAEEHGFGHIVECQCYNVLDKLPDELVERADWFYTNPPYGSKNEGLSGLVFIHRGLELSRRVGSSGCLILPYDQNREWARRAMWKIQNYLVTHGYVISEMIQQLHTYWLRDNPVLASSVVIADRLEYHPPDYFRQCIPIQEAEKLYGESVKRYPHYIRKGGPEFSWE